MPDDTDPTDRIRIDGDEILYGRRTVGQVTDSEITLNLGWCRLAGLGVVLEDDPKLDNHRGGIAFERKP